LIPKEPLLEDRRRRKAYKPQKGMFRLRERNTALEVKTSKRNLNVTRLRSDGSPDDPRETEGRSARTEDTTRCCLKCREDPREGKAQEGIGRMVALTEYCHR
jgi:hypothetical protein